MPLRALLTWSLPQQKATREGAELMLYKQNTPRDPCLEILGLSYQVTSLRSYQFSGCTLQFFFATGKLLYMWLWKNCCYGNAI